MVACTGRPQSRLVRAAEADRQPRPQQGQNPKKDNLPTTIHRPQDGQRRHISLTPMPRHRLWSLCPTVPSDSGGLALWWLAQGEHNQDWCLPLRQTVNPDPNKDRAPRKTTSPPPHTKRKMGNVDTSHSRQCPDTACGLSALLSRVTVGVLPYGGLYRETTIKTGACR